MKEKKNMKNVARIFGAFAIVALIAGGFVATSTIFGSHHMEDEQHDLPEAPAKAQAGQYNIDPAHTSVYFHIGHYGISKVYGRFNEVQGSFNVGDDPSFQFTIQTQSIDTNVEQRDNHLRSQDFFHAAQFREITFESTSVRDTDYGYEVQGELTLHGQTNTITVPLQRIGNGEFNGTYRAGYATEFTLKRSDYGMENMLDTVGDQVTLMISFEGERQ